MHEPIVRFVVAALGGHYYWCFEELHKNLQHKNVLCSVNPQGSLFFEGVRGGGHFFLPPP